jgi:iron complex outermembrane receptor protein
MRMNLSRALCATTALATGALLATGAMAQSTTGSTTVEELVVTGSSGPRANEGLIQQVQPKTRTTIDEQFIQRQQPGQTIAETLNVVPGYNFNNNDAFGNSGGDIRVRSFDCARISFQWDGMQLNDSGNYACFTNQVGDSEIIHTADVSQGTTDVDAPSASAVGGSINYVTKMPSKDMRVIANGSIGRYSYKRGFLELDSGEFGPWGTRAFVAGSWTNYNKFKGLGELDKKQFNARIYQPLRDNGDFAALAFHYNRNRNNFYNNPTLLNYQTDGYKFDEDQKCIRLAPVAGTAQNEANDTIIDYLGVTKTGSCTGYYNTRINPSNTGNVRGQIKYHITDNIILTADPSFQYVLANGGGFTLLSETNNMLRGSKITANATTNLTPGGPGVDLNGDGDTLDTIATYSPSNTNTRRYGLNASLIWLINENNTFRLAYSYDDAHHRQTSEYSFYDQDLNPLSVFGGKDGHGPKIITSDGSFVRNRDRFSIAHLDMIAAEYNGKFFDDMFEVRLGVRLPYFRRELNQFCYSPIAPFSTFPVCTTQPPVAVVNGVTAPTGATFLKGNGSTLYLPPYASTLKYHKALPNIGAAYNFAEGHQVYVSYAKGFSAPKTDNLYNAVRDPATGTAQPELVNPEKTDTFDVGYRFTRSNIQVTLDAYYTNFKNKIQNSFDPVLGISLDRNIGTVHVKGADVGIAWAILDNLTWTGNASYNSAKLQDDILVATGAVSGFIPTKGKYQVETPKYQLFQRFQWEPMEDLSLGIQGKYVGKRYSTDVNDESTKAYQVVDFDARWNLAFLGEDHPTYLQLNVKNLFNERYLGAIPTTSSNAIVIRNAAGQTVSGASAPRYSPGAPRSYELTLHTEF